MRINGLVACWNFADYFCHGIERWAHDLDSLTVVTHPDDEATKRLARRYGLSVVETDLWTADGAWFNKGRCLELARTTAVPSGGWLLLFDADMVPEKQWLRKIIAAKPVKGRFYGARRHQCHDLSRIDDPEWPLIRQSELGSGFFQLFHTSDPCAQDTPLIETRWRHGGTYDVALRHRWPGLPHELPIRLTHLGEPKMHWYGRGNHELLARRYMFHNLLNIS